MILPDVVFLFVKSVTLEALDATLQPGILQPWVDELETYVERNGKFTQFAVGYLPVSPPPVFWDYKCRKCLVWQEPNACKWVDGELLPQGWCTIWVPATGYKPFTWPRELLAGDW